MASMMLFLGQLIPQSIQPVLAAATIPAAPTVNVSSDSATGASVALPAFTLTEGVAGDIAAGTFNLGFAYRLCV